MAEEPQPRSRSHRGHVAPAACDRGVCVYRTLHDEFVAKLGGDRGLAERRVMTFYTDVIANIPADEPITSDNYDFWRKAFADHFAAPKAPAFMPYPDADATAARNAALFANAPDDEERQRVAELHRKRTRRP